MVFARYENALVANVTRISAIESALKTLTWMLPGKFKDSELASETIQSLLNVLGVYHDSVLHRTVADMPSHVRPPATAHARYTRWWTKHSRAYARLSRTLAILNYTSLLMEMAIRKKRGRAAADQAILAIESVKAAIRLAILRLTDRATLQPPVPEREVDPSVLDLHRPKLVVEGDSGDLTDTRVSFTEDNSDYWTGQKAGVTRPTLASLRKKGANADDFLSKRVLTLEHVQPPKELVARARGIAKLAEIIWIMRPLLYVLALRRYGRKHTLPFLLSLSLEYLAYSLRTTSEASLSKKKAMAGLPHPTAAERDETSKRARAFWWYLLRGPVWENWSRGKVEGVFNTVEKVPLIGLASTVLRDYLPLVDEYYYYSSS